MLEFLQIFFLGQHSFLIYLCEASLSFEFLTLLKSISTCLLSLLLFFSLDDSVAGDVQLIHVLLQAIYTFIITSFLLLGVEPSLPPECAFGHLLVEDLSPVQLA